MIANRAAPELTVVDLCRNADNRSASTIFHFVKDFGHRYQRCSGLSEGSRRPFRGCKSLRSVVACDTVLDLKSICYRKGREKPVLDHVLQLRITTSESPRSAPASLRHLLLHRFVVLRRPELTL